MASDADGPKALIDLAYEALDRRAVVKQELDMLYRRIASLKTQTEQAEQKASELSQQLAVCTAEAAQHMREFLKK